MPAILIQIMLGFSLAACAGLRAWLPLFVLGLLSRFGSVQLGENFSLLARTDVLIVLGIATVIEFLGDKIVALDHFLDAAGTVLRPIAGAVLATSVLVQIDPLLASLVGTIIGGGTALTVHAGKAALRAKSTALLPIHGGLGNTALSFGEDALVGFWLWIAYHSPVIAFLLAAAVLALAIWLFYKLIKTGSRLVDSLLHRSRRPIGSGP